jgi:hypothetical protein
MTSLAVKMGVATGLVVIPCFVLPFIKIFMGDCFFEQGCGRYESLILFGSFVASIATSIGVGWGVFKLIGFIQKFKS